MSTAVSSITKSREASSPLLEVEKLFVFSNGEAE
jgi:hypothetical protein